ncbi:hypothetical protein TELCIR_10399 [Teladorsagia circumcincta]|uniref:Phosphotransferase n=1 Tax=Teladorsagia circumcincta TaxID=45464 RepID=A0A2G9UC90_TELCI|nr:hypothetical protein TELCIR_10399 [Teladorsagia circumcincta]
MVVAIDGSTYKYHPFFDHWVVDKIKELIDPGLEFKVVQTGDGSGKGAALIAAIVTRVKRAEEKRKKDEAARAAREAEEAEKRRKAEEERLRLEAEEREREKRAEEERAHKIEELLSYSEDRVKEEQNNYVTLQE